MQQAEAVVKTTLQAAILLILFNCTSHVFCQIDLWISWETHPDLSPTRHYELTYHNDINVKIEKLYSMHYREDTNVALLSVSPPLIRIDAMAMHVLCISR